METNDVGSKKYEVAYNYAYELLTIKYPDWKKNKLSKAAHLCVTIMIAVDVTDDYQKQSKQ